MNLSKSLAPLRLADIHISVVLPVYSETESVVQIVNWLCRQLGRHLEEIIIVLSPCSQPQSKATCQALALSDARIRLHLQEKNPGLGNAVREGLRRTTGSLVLLMDSDGEMEIETVVRMVGQMAADGHAMVVGSRWSKGGGFVGYGRIKYGFNWCFQQLFRALFRTSIRDLTYGYKLMRGELARGIAWEGTLHEIACETTLKPIRLGVSVSEVPTKWTARRQGSSKNTFWRNFRYVAMALRILVLGASWRMNECTNVPAVSKITLAGASS